MNGTPFATGAYFLRDRQGNEHWVVAVRARFELALGRLPRIAGQAPVRMAPQYADEAARELAAESDLAPFRPHVDIILRGSAQPPGDGSGSRLLRLKFGGLEKRVQAFGPRRLLRRGGKWLVDRQPFLPFPLSWTRSLGGPDVAAADAPDRVLHPANPIGIGWSARLAGVPDGTEFELPQLERPDSLVHPARPLPQPVGFGAVQPAWQPRASRAGTYDEAWRNGHAPLAPPDFSDAFHQAASDDQVYEPTLKGGEPIELDGFHPEGTLAFQLPQVLLDARTRIGVGVVDSRFRLVGVEIDATERMLDMIWNIAVPCPGGDHLVRHTSVFLQQMSGFSR